MFLQVNQQKYLCNYPTAKSTNPVSGVGMPEGLMSHVPLR